MIRVWWYALASALLPVSLALANGDHGQTFEHGHRWGGGGGFGMIFGIIVMIVVIAAIVGVIVLLVRWLTPARPQRGGSERTALGILEERFARGEIDAQEFQERRRTLEE